MKQMLRLSVEQAHSLVYAALTGSGATPQNSTYLTEAIIDTELSGLEGHGFYWLEYYCKHLLSGKVDGQAQPYIDELSAVAFQVDAKNGFAHPAIETGINRVIPAARKFGIAAFGVKNSYSAATLGFHTGVMAKAGLIAFGFTNSFPAMAPIGGNVPVIGTNPLSFAVPGKKGEIALLIDQSSSSVAWTAVKQAAEKNIPIPMDWALDSSGLPTTDAHAGLAGSMAPAGGYKGFNQGLIVEVLCAAVAGSCLGTQMGSFTRNDGRPIGNGQFFIAIEPEIFSAGLFSSQIQTLTKSILSQPDVRLPNTNRLQNQARLICEGLPIGRQLHDRLLDYHKPFG